MVTLSIILTFGAMIFWGTGDFFLQKMSRKLGNIEALIFINFVGFLLLLPFIVTQIHSLTLATFFPLFILSIIDTAFGLTALKAYAQGKLCVVDVILIMELPLTVFFGIVLFKEKLNLVQVILMLTIITGIFFIAKERLSYFRKILAQFFKSGPTLEKGILWALLAAFLSALHNFFIAFNARETSPLMTIWLPWTLSLLWILIFLFFKIGIKKTFTKLFDHIANYKKVIIFGSLLDTAAWLCYAGALAQKELSITTAVTESYPVIAIFLGVRFNREKISGWQYLGAILALSGSIIIALISK